MTILACNNLSKSYRGAKVLSDLSFSVDSGEFVTILGASGCGKSTLLRLFAGFEQPDAGSIYLGGQDITALPPKDRLLNLVFQDYALFSHLTVIDNVAFGLRCRGVSKSTRYEQARVILKKMRLETLSEAYPKTLSGGQQQRVALARAMILQPQAILLDEPLSALDFSLRRQMQLELKALQREFGVTCVMVSHDQEEALSLSDRIILMREGKIEQSGSPRELYEKPINRYVAEFIGRTNTIPAQVIRCEYGFLSVEAYSQHLDLPLKKGSHFRAGEWVDLIIRPEDIQAWSINEVPQKYADCLSGVVAEIIYKGSTVELLVKLDQGKQVSVTEFFNEQDDQLIYHRGERVVLTWPEGWEVIFAHEA